MEAASEKMQNSTPKPVGVSIVMEWANTVWNSIPRAHLVLEELVRQWEGVIAGRYPTALPEEAAGFLDGLDPDAELLIVSGDSLDEACEREIRRRVPECFDLSIRVAKGLEYYPLKNFGAELAGGDLLLFLDSDVLPDPGFLAHLLGSFAQANVHVVTGQPYVAPTDLVARAYALGWTYALRNDAPGLINCPKFYANNVAFRSEVFPKAGFPAIGLRTRGAASDLQHELARNGIKVWQNGRAAVDHPPPNGFRHMMVRALAHGRDHYMGSSEQRSLEGLSRSVEIAGRRFFRGWATTFREWRRVGLNRWEIPAALAILAGYYGFFALGGVLTYLHPQAMGRSFRL
jgi:hypothetical protein